MSEHQGCPCGPKGKKGPWGLSPARIYLAGPIGQVTKDEMISWRQKAAKILREKGIEVEDPTDRMGFPADVIVNGDKDAIRRSGLLLAFAPQGVPFVGTSMEIFFAHEVLKIPVVTWGNGNGSHPSPWIKLHSNYVCETLEEALTEICGE